MSPRLKISALVVERLKKIENNSSGRLFGVFNEKSIIILGIGVSSQTSEVEEQDDFYNYDLIPHLPASIVSCGVFHVTKEGNVGDIGRSDVLGAEETSVIVKIDSSSTKIITYIYEKGSVKEEEHILIDENDLSKLFLHLRLTATIPLSCDFQSENLQDAIGLIEQKVEGGNAAFHINQSNVYLLGNSTNDINGISPDSTVEELFISVKKDNGNVIDVMDVNMYLKGTNNEMTPQVAPIIKYIKKIYKHSEIHLPLDTLTLALRNLKIKDLYPILAESLCRNLILNKKSLLMQLKSGGIKDVSLPQTYHFWPQTCSHFLSIVYPSKQTPEQLKKFRELFHVLLLLPMDKPLLRRGNAYDFSGAVQNTDSDILINPHEGLGKSGVPEGEPCFVQGMYAYHHYMQNNFDDNGWGCAYRSLQTVFSWFRLQGYTNMPVPSHKDIQQCLVNIGDKPSSFIGSKQWIGSTEVSFVLDTMLGVTCRISNISSGEEMMMKGGELSYHFKTQGTPVMIGGGVLAHTIIGVDYNKKTGAIKFLILDPHYTGGEDLKIIQSKGWCGWKGLDFWKKDSFYNMCMPLRPKCV